MDAAQHLRGKRAEGCSDDLKKSERNGDVEDRLALPTHQLSQAVTRIFTIYDHRLVLIGLVGNHLLILCLEEKTPALCLGAPALVV
jgi:hypothetical protein